MKKVSEKDEILAKNSWMNVVIKSALISGGFAVYIFVESDTRDRLSRMESKIDQIETKLTDRIDRVETKIERVETKIERVETRINRVETKIDEVRGYLRFNDDPAMNETPPPDSND